MLHECRLPRSRLALHPQHALMTWQVGAVSPCAELCCVEEPVAGVVAGGGDVLFLGVEVREVQRAQACYSQFSCYV